MATITATLVRTEVEEVMAVEEDMVAEGVMVAEAISLLLVPWLLAFTRIDRVRTILTVPVATQAWEAWVGAIHTMIPLRLQEVLDRTDKTIDRVHFPPWMQCAKLYPMLGSQPRRLSRARSNPWSSGQG